MFEGIMLIGLKNYKHSDITLQSILKQKGLWDLMEQLLVKDPKLKDKGKKDKEKTTSMNLES